ncbi:MAG: beta-propeller domain-containing protein [Deltaproteobacteria bacterium]|nr:beta-propeller domain-containing protein [Deltaproteobacteria bacterium]
MKTRLTMSVLVLAVTMLGGPGCEPGSGTEEPRIVGKSLAALKVAAGCDDVLAALKDQELEEMNRLLDQNLEYALQMISGGGYGCWMAEADAGYGGGGPRAGAPSAGTNQGGGAKSYSQTNTQVAGVDEADFIKNDGNFIYVVADGAFQVIDAWPAAGMHRISAFPIEGTPKRTYVHAGKALVYSALGPVASGNGGGYGPWGYYGGGEYGGQECTYGYDCEFTGDGQILKVTLLDLADPAEPKLLRETTFSGSYLNSRRIGDVVHTVAVFPEVSVPGLTYWPKEMEEYWYWCGGDKKAMPTELEIKTWFALMREKNTQIIQNASIAQFLPGIKDVRHLGGGQTIVEEGLLEDCHNFYLSQENDGAAFLSLVSVDMTDLEGVGVTTVVGKPGAVYASFDALYVAVRHYPDGVEGGWYWDDSDGINEATTVHKFGLADGIETSYKGSGAVKGRILNQFSMDEMDGVLRIATTMGRVPSPGVYSTVATLAEKNGELVVAGMVDHIAPEEDIRSVRFNGDLGFVVTFKKTDPLFVLDLSDPADPKIKGELKIPGFSTYMHVMDKGHILAIGYDAEDHGDFAYFLGIQLQVFDVTVLEEPKVMHKVTIGTRGSTSDAATDHLAFNFFPDNHMLAIPMTVCSSSAGGGSYGTEMTFSGLMVYKVTLEAGFEYQGGVPHLPIKKFEGDNEYGSQCSNWWTRSNSLVKRSVFMDDWVFSIAMDQIKAAPLADLEHPAATVSLDLP